MNKEVIANIKSLGLDMINEAGNGHPGIVLGAAPIIYTLYAKHLNINPKDPKWLNRDRFILSAGHGSALLYATLHMAGFEIRIDDLKNFRQVGSITPGHPEYNLTPGVDATTGPLGQGLATAVGLAIGEKMLESKYFFPTKSKLKEPKSLFKYNIYVLCSDGDFMEGITQEAASLAGNLKLDNLIVLYDSNNVSLDGPTNLSFNENVLDRFKALGWHTDYVKHGDDVYDIDKAISKAKEAKQPAIIEINTIIGQGSINEGTCLVHGKKLDEADLAGVKQSLNIQDEPFCPSQEALVAFQKDIATLSIKKINQWTKDYADYLNNVLKGNDQTLNHLSNQPTILNFNDINWNFNTQKRVEVRQTNHEVMNHIADKVDYFISGSADLSSSTKTDLTKFTNFSSEDYAGRNIFYGVREHAMAAISSGLALTNFRVNAATFLVFADYMKPAIRLAALMHLPVTYIFTHDSIMLGSDGPTHQPIEQLAMLRATPNLNVYRPADANEVVGAWTSILNTHDQPSALIIAKGAVDLLSTTNSREVINGAYIIRKEVDRLHGILIATGTEVSTAYHLANELYDTYKLDLRVVSMPCMELFLKKEQAYQDLILPKGNRTVVLEAASSFGWHRFVYNDNYLITLDQFGFSGSKDDVLKKMSFDYETIKERIKQLFR